MIMWLLRAGHHLEAKVRKQRTRSELEVVRAQRPQAVALRGLCECTGAGELSPGSPGPQGHAQDAGVSIPGSASAI